MLVDTINEIKKDDIIVKNEIADNLKSKKINKNPSFFRRFFALFIPSALQNLAIVIIFFVNNIFLSQLSSAHADAKTAVGLANPIINFVLFIILAWSGGLSIMMGQYYGSKEHNKNQELTVFGFAASFVLYIPFMILILVIPNQLINLISGFEIGKAGKEIIEYSTMYLRIMVLSFIPFIFVEIMSTGFQTTNKSVIPLYSVIVNLVFNLVFVLVSIILTKDDPLLSIILVCVIDIIAKIFQALFLFLYIIIKKYEPINFFRKIKFEKDVIKKCLKYAAPSFFNDVLFSIFLLIQSFALLNYSNNVLQINWIENNNQAFGNIQEATTNVNVLIEFTGVIWPGMSAATAVMVGNSLGAGNIKEAKENSKKCLFWSFIISLSIILILFGASWFINDLLNHGSKPWMNKLAKYMEWALLPIILSQGIFSVIIFSIRTGGSKIIVVCDALVLGISSVIMLILTLCGVMQYMNPVVYIFILQMDQIIRMVISIFMYKYYNWAKNLTQDNNEIKVTKVEVQNSSEELI
ncbi:MAG: hypothetical protein K2I49_00390 [Ureaplasma sp.]|nr:hypothetical protein [Ureaplasma sp.]